MLTRMDFWLTHTDCTPNARRFLANARHFTPNAHIFLANAPLLPLMQTLKKELTQNILHSPDTNGFNCQGRPFRGTIKPNDQL